MKESEKADKNVNAREIIANVLKELDMNAPSFAKAPASTTSGYSTFKGDGQKSSTLGS